MQKKTGPTQVGAVSVPGQEERRPGRGWGTDGDSGAGTVLLLDLGGFSLMHLLTRSAVQFSFSTVSMYFISQ